VGISTLLQAVSAYIVITQNARNCDIFFRKKSPQRPWEGDSPHPPAPSWSLATQYLRPCPPSEHFLRLWIWIQIWMLKDTLSSGSAEDHFGLRYLVLSAGIRLCCCLMSYHGFLFSMACFIMGPSSLGGGRILRRTLSVCPSVRPSR